MSGSYPVISSDTIFGGLVSCYAYLFGASRTARLLEAFASKVPFKITSAFPYVGDVFFIPKPLDADLNCLPGLEPKKAKKVKFIPLSLAEADAGDWGKAPLRVCGSFLVPEGLGTPPIKSEERTRVVLDAITSASHVYYAPVCTFSSGAGLWFLLQVEDPAAEASLLASVRLLGDEGIGGERSYGLGAFTPEIEDAEDFLSGKKQGRYVLLSLYHPRREEIQLFACGRVSYRVVERGGFVFLSSYVSKRVRMLAEGSALDFEPEGELVDVTPPGVSPRVYRCGIAFPVRLRYPVRGLGT